MMPTTRKHGHLMSSGSALTASVKGLPHLNTSTTHHHHSASICTTPAGHTALATFSLSNARRGSL